MSSHATATQRSFSDDVSFSLTVSFPVGFWSGGGVSEQTRTPGSAGSLAKSYGTSVVTQASVEARRPVVRRGLLRLDVAAFVDAAVIGGTDTTTTREIDVGGGLRMRIPGEGTIRVDVARGLRDRAHALSVGWELPWPAWP